MTEAISQTQLNFSEGSNQNDLLDLLQDSSQQQTLRRPTDSGLIMPEDSPKISEAQGSPE